LNDDWKCVVDDRAVEFLLSLPSRQSSRVMDALAHLARHPSRPAAEFGHDSTGRPLQAFTVVGFEIVFWVDHFGKEVRVVGIFAD
jgi:hypothetical protein